MDIKDYHAQLYGVTQCGKTLLGLKLLHMHPGVKLFIDTKYEHKYHKHFNYVREITDAKYIIHNEKEFDGKSICLLIDGKDLKKQLVEFSNTLFEYKKYNPVRRIAVLIDEMQEYVSSRSVDGAIRGLFVQGMSKNIRMSFTSQGWSMVNKNIRNNCEVTIIMKQRQQDLDQMMDLGLLPYKLNSTGHRESKVKFNKKYRAYVEIGIEGDFKILQ